MFYVEFLRVMRVLRVVGYILGAVLLLSLALRPFSHGNVNHGSVAGVDENSIPGHVNADGSTTKTFTGKHGEHVSVQIGTDGREQISITEPATNREHKDTEKLNMGDARITVNGGMRTKTITADDTIPLFILLLIAACASSIVATIFGLALSRENDGHLELAWTKPTTRESYALGAIACDVAAIVATACAVLVTVVAVLGIYGGYQYIRSDEHTLPTIIFGIVFALSFYGVVLAMTSSLRGGGLVLGILWPACSILPGLVRIEWMQLGTVARTLNTINPIAYLYAFCTSPDATRIYTLMPNGLALQILIPCGLFVLGIALSLVQWRRLEA